MSLIAKSPQVFHNFAKSLASSKESNKELLSMWELCYKQFFGKRFVQMNDYTEDRAKQRQGIDRGVVLDDGREVFVDEKIRGRNKKTGRVYTDIGLEEWSDEEQCIEGWVLKPLRIDYIAYAIAPLGICYLIPFLGLQAAWQKYGAVWKQSCFKMVADNKCNGRTWRTISWAVKTDVLFNAINDVSRVTFSQFEYDSETGAISAVPSVQSSVVPSSPIAPAASVVINLMTNVIISKPCLSAREALNIARRSYGKAS